MNKLRVLFAIVLIFQNSAQEKPGMETLQSDEKAVDFKLNGVG